jgi:hypothetical protein
VSLHTAPFSSVSALLPILLIIITDYNFTKGAATLLRIALFSGVSALLPHRTTYNVVI